MTAAGATVTRIRMSDIEECYISYTYYAEYSRHLNPPTYCRVKKTHYRREIVCISSDVRP